MPCMLTQHVLSFYVLHRDTDGRERLSRLDKNQCEYLLELEGHRHVAVLTLEALFVRELLHEEGAGLRKKRTHKKHQKQLFVMTRKVSLAPKNNSPLRKWRETLDSVLAEKKEAQI